VTNSERIKLGIAIVVGAILVVLFLRGVQGHRTEPPPAPTMFRTFDLPDPPLPSPTPIIGLYEFAVPQRPAPTASPTAAPARPEATPAAGHTSSGSGTGTIRQRDHELVGVASWHATGRDGLYAAACAPLRRAMGPNWRGRRVLVASGRRAIELVLNDFCASRAKTIDLSDEAFRYFAPLSRGVIRVEIGW
jgi:hypothetical protein